MLPFGAHSRHAALSDRGLTVGSDTFLARFVEGTNRLVVDLDRLSGLVAIASGRPLTIRDVTTIAAAADHWQAGDKALANLRLVFSDLHCPEAPSDLHRLKAAEILFDAGLSVTDLDRTFVRDQTVAGDLGKGSPDQPRVPAGNGSKSGEWTSRLWSRFSAWLDEDVPVYDLDTGDEVGTRSRASAIATNPLSILAVGAAAVLAGEVLLPAAAVGSVEAVGVGTVAEGGAAIAESATIVSEETEALTPFAQRYLSTNGGRLGNTATRRQLHEIAREYVKSGKYDRFFGDGEGSEEFIPGVGPGTSGSTYVDFTAVAKNGARFRIQTVDTLADGATPVAREQAAAARIRAAARSDDSLILIPKKSP